MSEDKRAVVTFIVNTECRSCRGTGITGAFPHRVLCHCIVTETAPMVKHRPMYRPEWAEFSRKTRGSGYVVCRCGELLKTFPNVREHWQRGHFDYIRCPAFTYDTHCTLEEGHDGGHSWYGPCGIESSDFLLSGEPCTHNKDHKGPHSWEPRKEEKR